MWCGVVWSGVVCVGRGEGERGGGEEVVVVVVRTLEYGVCVSPYAPTTDAPNWVAEHLGASSRRPRHPFPALMAGETPGRVPVYTALKTHLVMP